MRKARRTTAAIDKPTRAPILTGEERREKERREVDQFGNMYSWLGRVR